MLDLRNFAYAAAKRYSGSFRPATDGPPLPAVRHWLAWNEPNNPVFLKPQFTKIGRRQVPAREPGHLRQDVQRDLVGRPPDRPRAARRSPAASTAPRGNNSGTLPRASISPLPFLRG